MEAFSVVYIMTEDWSPRESYNLSWKTILYLVIFMPWLVWSNVMTQFILTYFSYLNEVETLDPSFCI